MNTEPLDEAFDALRRMPVPERPPDGELLARLAAGTSPAAEPVTLSRRRTLMRVVSWSAAAATLAAAAAVFLLAGPPSTALADVLQAAEKHKLVKYKLTQTTDDKQNGNATGTSTAYADLKAPRFRTESRGMTLNNTVESVSVFVEDGRKDVCLHLLSETVIEGNVDKDTPDLLKKILTDGRFPRKEARLTKASGDFTPATDNVDKSILENLRELEQHKGVTATKDKRDGKELLKFRLEDGNTTTTLWVDRATKLPFRLEREITDQTANISRNHWVLSDFEWDPELKGVKDADELFSVTPPAGYKVSDETKPKADK
jgi:hypothetical protein